MSSTSSATSSTTKLTSKDAEYCAYYCEENVVRLIQTILVKSNEFDERFASLNQQLYAVFISNENESVPFWNMRNATSSRDPLVYDYHVIAVCVDKRDRTANVLDLDNAVGLQTKWDQYRNDVLRSDTQLPARMRRKYRVVPAKTLLETFSSDRSHMIDSKTGKWKATPPTWPPIQAKPNANNLFSEFVNMNSTDIGTVMNEKEFQQFMNSLKKSITTSSSPSSTSTSKTSTSSSTSTTSTTTSSSTQSTTTISTIENETK